MTARCKSCNAPILWASRIAGNPVPLDPEPVADGKFALGGQNTNGPIFCVLLGKDDPYDGDRYMPHHVTCPQGREWRKKA